MTTEDQEQIDQETKELRRDLNHVIRGTIEYKHGGFRIKIYRSSSGVLNFIVANTSWITKFGELFNRIAHVHGYYLTCDNGKGIYNLIPHNNGERKGSFKAFETLVGRKDRN